MARRLWLKLRVAVRSQSTRRPAPSIPRLASLSPQVPSRLALGFTSLEHITAMKASLLHTLTSVDSIPYCRNSMYCVPLVALASPGLSRICQGPSPLTLCYYRLPTGSASAGSLSCGGTRLCSFFVLGTGRFFLSHFSLRSIQGFSTKVYTVNEKGMITTRTHAQMRA